MYHALLAFSNYTFCFFLHRFLHKFAKLAVWVPKLRCSKSKTHYPCKEHENAFFDMN